VPRPARKRPPAPATRPPIRYLSLFSGIEAATVAWHPLGWQPVAFAEIDPFCTTLLAHYYPSIPNLGDVTALTESQVRALGHVDVVVFGSPCQDLSVAGLRAGLEGRRSNLFFAGMDIARWSGARFTLWENVPGAFSSNHGKDFAAVVGQMCGTQFDPPKKGWQTTGVALGPTGLTEWCVLDSQWFGVPQRRRRVFALLDTGDWASRPPLLFEPEGLRGNPPPRREEGQRTAPGTAPSLTGSGRGVARAGESRGQDPVIPVAAPLGAGEGMRGWRNDLDQGAYVPVTTHQNICPTLRAGGNQTGGDRPPGTDVDTCESLVTTHQNTGQGWWNESDVATACRAKGGTGHGDFESETFVTHSLRADGFDASEDGTGRGTPLVPVVASTLKNNHGGGGFGSDPSETFIPVAFSSKDSAADAGPLSPTLRAMGHSQSHPNAGGQVAVAIHQNQRGEITLNDTAGALNEGGGKPGQGYPCIAFAGMAQAGSGWVPPSCPTNEECALPLDTKRAQAVAYRLPCPTVRDIILARRRAASQPAPVPAADPFCFEPRFARNDRGAPDSLVPPLKAQSGMTGKGDSAPCVAFYPTAGSDFPCHEELSPPVEVGSGGQSGNPPGVAGAGMAVRRLTPRECERLQAFPDNYTLIPYHGKPAADGNRYKSIGNSMTTTVIRWIGLRIQSVLRGTP
jgi:DNA (cytosine-5)-methyltransferase 1